MAETKATNRLINSSSPYLLQHAHNPVDWYEWGEEALSRARNEGKPILVSIGYSSCHWCHVMEREVFEKDSIARIMNNMMICIKVDREERPDIDSIYMDAVQAMGVHGGWPLNVFLTPDQKPFYGGTYFPPDQWVNLLNGIEKAFRERREDIDESANELTSILSRQDTAHYKKAYEFRELRSEIDQAFTSLSKAFDQKWGGLDKAPKFVMPSVWLWLLRYHYVTGNEEALSHLKLTLDKIAWGGIYDQIGGGFARYSVDGYWFVPHFEKMLYDNAQMMSLYAEAFAVTKNELYKNVVQSTFEWLQGEMMHPEGGFYSALDADSEGVEGKFYIWTKSEIEQILKDDARLFCAFFNVEDEGNWEHGNSILIQTEPLESFLKRHKLSAEKWNSDLERMKEILLAERDKRVRPGLDDKVITSWNAMTIVGLVDAYRYLGEQRFLEAALKNMRFLETNLINGNTIARSFKGKKSVTTGFLDDYAYVIQAYMKLYQVTFNESFLTKAIDLMNFTISEFHDAEDGFFFYTSSSSEKLIARKKELFDNVIPSSNSVMIQNLTELGTILGEEKWKTLAESIVTPIAHLVISEPNYMSNWGIAYLQAKHKITEVVIADENLEKPPGELLSQFVPFSVLIGATHNNKLALAEGKSPLKGKLTYYVCFDKTCHQPVQSVSEALREIASFHPQ